MALECLPTALLCDASSKPIALSAPDRRRRSRATPVGNAVTILTRDIGDGDLVVVLSASPHDEASLKRLADAPEPT